MRSCVLAMALCCVAAQPSSAQAITSWGFGPTWSNMVTAYSGGSSSGNTMRRFLSLWVGHRLDERGPLVFDAGAHLVAKGFEVTGPTIHAEWLDLPVTATLRSSETGPFLSLGPYLGLRLRCSRSAMTVIGRVSEGCGRHVDGPLSWTPIRRWDLGAKFDFGLRVARADGQDFMLGAGLSRSLIDLQPEESGRRRNEVVSIWVGFGLSRSTR